MSRLEGELESVHAGLCRDTAATVSVQRSGPSRGWSGQMRAFLHGARDVQGCGDMHRAVTESFKYKDRNALMASASAQDRWKSVPIHPTATKCRILPGARDHFRS